MLITGIKSKPVYAPLRADPGGRYHLMLGFGPGGAALLRVLGEMRDSAPQALQSTRVLIVPDAPAVVPGAAATAVVGDAPPAVDRFKPFGLPNLDRFDGAASLFETFRTVLEESYMGTRLYVAGPESFIGLAMKIALEFDLNKDEIRAEEVGTSARRVYCVHCRVTTEGVRTNIVRCGG